MAWHDESAVQLHDVSSVYIGINIQWSVRANNGDWCGYPFDLFSLGCIPN